MCFDNLSTDYFDNIIFLRIQKQHICQKKEKLRRPGIEPGSTAWKATMLTITPPTLETRGHNLRISNINSILF